MKPIILNLNNFISKLLSWVIVLSVFSYPITAVLILQLGLPGSTSNFIIRIILSFLYILLLFLSLLKGGKRWSLYLLPLITFLILYSFRLIFDVSIRGVQILGYSNFYVYSYYFGLTLLPCVAIIGARKFINFQHLISLCFYFLVVANILLIYQMLTQGENLSFVDILATRAQTIVEGENRTFINPIVVGFFGSNLSLFSISSLLIQKKKSLFLIILYAVGIGLGIVNLLLGASRGPFIVFVLLLLLVIYYYITHEQNKLRLSMRIISVSIIGFILVSRYVIPFISKTEIFLFSRLEAFFEGRGKGRKEVRDYAFEGAWNDFLSSPIIGRQYVGTYDNFYPHNIPLEVLMATGVIGFVIFSLILMIYLFSFIRLIGKEKESSIFIILIVGATSFLAGLTSGSIFFTPNFWIFILVSILTVTDNESRNPY